MSDARCCNGSSWIATIRSTLRAYVEALGGRLSLVAEFPNQEPVILSGIAALDGDTLAGAHKS